MFFSVERKKKRKKKNWCWSSKAQTHTHTRTHSSGHKYTDVLHARPVCVCVCVCCATAHQHFLDLFVCVASFSFWSLMCFGSSRVFFFRPEKVCVDKSQKNRSVRKVLPLCIHQLFRVSVSRHVCMYVCGCRSLFFIFSLSIYVSSHQQWCVSVEVTTLCTASFINISAVFRLCFLSICFSSRKRTELYLRAFGVCVCVCGVHRCHHSCASFALCIFLLFHFSSCCLSVDDSAATGAWRDCFVSFWGAENVRVGVRLRVNRTLQKEAPFPKTYLGTFFVSVLLRQHNSLLISPFLLFTPAFVCPLYHHQTNSET